MRWCLTSLGFHSLWAPMLYRLRTLQYGLCLFCSTDRAGALRAYLSATTPIRSHTAARGDIAISIKASNSIAKDSLSVGVIRGCFLIIGWIQQPTNGVISISTLTIVCFNRVLGLQSISSVTWPSRTSNLATRYFIRLCTASKALLLYKKSWNGW